MKKTLYFAIIIAFLFALQSCEIMYYPNMQNVPLFKEKNEVRASLSASNVQAAYSVTNNIGIMVNGQFGSRSWNTTSENPVKETKYEYSSNRLFAEGGVGYFMPVSTNGVFEIYGGAGAGKIDFKKEITETNYYEKYDLSANTMRFFIQPNIGYTNEVVDIAFSTRFAALKFYDLKNTFIKDDLIDNDINDIDKPLYTFIEPAVTVRFGWKYIKFHTQVMMSLKTNYESLNYLPLSFNAGMHLNIAPRYKKVKKN